MTRKKKEPENKINEKDLDRLYERRNMLDLSRAKHSDSLDKYLLTLSISSLYLSINFTSSLEGWLFCTKILSWGWFLLIISIISVLISFYLGEKAHLKQMEINDSEIKWLIYQEKEVNRSNNWNLPIEICKGISIVSFILGVSFLSYFYFINI